MKRICYTLNLKNKKSLIKEYIDHHNNVWPEVIKSMKDSGIINAEIYNFSNRLFFLIEVDETFLAHQLQGQLMAAVFASDQTTLAGNHGVRTLNLTSLLTQSAVLGATKVTTGLDAITESSTAAELNDGIAGAGALVTILAVGRIY
mgnify:CR=1 FL=1